VAAFADAPMRPAWDALRDATDAFSAALPHGLRVLFDLGRVVCEAGDASERYRQPGFDPSRWLYVTLAPRVEQLLADARRLHPCLAALPELPCGNAAGGEPPFDGMTKAIRALADRVPALLADAATQTQSLPAATVASQPLTVPAMTEPAAGETVPAVAVEPPVQRVPRLAEGESFQELLALKQRIDPAGTYVGQSLAILRLFQQIEDLNRLSDLPVTLLGPSRSGKTRLAEVIHRASSRKDKPFLHLNASELNGGDPNLFREKWMGFGKNSAVGNRKSSDFADGWLQTTEGGTIFVDELHSLDIRAVDYLRALLGRDETKFRPPTGEQKTFSPDVRLVFATYRDIATLKDEGVLPEDFTRRLLGRYLTVPSLNDRREDIPLFVDRYREGRLPDERFLLALLQHDWRSEEVDGLLTAIRAAVSRTPEGQPLTIDSLRDTLPAATQGRVAALVEVAVRRELYQFLIDLLRQQGFEPGTRGRSLNVRLAELMGVHRSTIDRHLVKLGLVPSGGGE
jgi:DNA-binding NtrC family response regulator